jgi:predicted DNA-binding transcriptional regulator AlpA
MSSSNIQRGAIVAQTILQLPETGYLRLPQIIGDKKARPRIPALIPVGKSTWWNGVRSGRYPAPVRTLGKRITAWRVEDIRALIHSLAEGKWE